MAIKFLTGIEVQGTPSGPATVTTAIVGETIEITFTQSTESVDAYQVWAAQGSGSYSLIAQVPKEDFASTMSVVDTSFDTGGTRNYRVYSLRAGVYSSPVTASRTYTVSALEPLNLVVTPMEEAFTVKWDYPDSRFVSHFEVYHHSHATQSSLSRNSASIVYSGASTVFIKAVDDDNYHQFWVEVITS